MSTHRTPLEVCERLIGSLEEVAEAGGVNAKRPYGWRAASQYRLAGDIPLIPARKILNWCAARGIPLRADHMLFGASEADLARLEWQMRALDGAANENTDAPEALPGVAAQ